MEIPRAFARQVERNTHQRLKAFAAHGEWFAVDVETAVEAAVDVVEQVKALCTVLDTDGQDWWHSGPRHSGADLIYLLGGTDFADKRLLPY